MADIAPPSRLQDDDHAMNVLAVAARILAARAPLHALTSVSWREAAISECVDCAEILIAEVKRRYGH